MADEDNTPRNRRERRAAAKESGKPVEAATSRPKVNAPQIPMAKPDRSGPKSKTLLDLYEDKKSLLEHGQPFAAKHQDGQVRDESGNILAAGLRAEDEEEEPLGPLANSVFWTLVLGMLHCTLDVLVFSQYRQDLEWMTIIKRTGTMIPILFLLIYLLRMEIVEKKFQTLKQILFFVAASAIGCYTIHVSNKYDYYAVMKQAPPLGTLWIWSVIEMDLGFAAGSLLVNVAYLWWKGYSVT